jgi:hypothetical protein
MFGLAVFSDAFVAVVFAKAHGGGGGCDNRGISYATGPCPVVIRYCSDQEEKVSCGVGSTYGPNDWPVECINWTGYYCKFKEKPEICSWSQKCVWNPEYDPKCELDNKSAKFDFLSLRKRTETLCPGAKGGGGNGCDNRKPSASTGPCITVATLCDGQKEKAECQADNVFKEDWPTECINGTDSHCWYTLEICSWVQKCTWDPETKVCSTAQGGPRFDFYRGRKLRPVACGGVGTSTGTLPPP